MGTKKLTKEDVLDAKVLPPAKKVKKLKVYTDKDFPKLKNDLIFRVIKGEPIEKTPVWIMRQAGRYLPEFRAVRAEQEFFKVCQTPELACEVTLQPIDRYPGLLDGSIIFCDIMVVPQAMGLEVQMVPGKGPTFPARLETPDCLKRLSPTPVDVDHELSYVYDAITLTRQKLDGRVPLFGFVGGPWTLMAYMIEGSGSKYYSKAKTWLHDHPKASHDLLQRITDVIVPFLVGQVKAGAQDFTEFALPYLTQIVDRVKKDLEKFDLNPPIVVFARNCHYALEQLEKTNYDVIQLGWNIDPKTARKAVTKTLQGNADPALLYAKPECVRKTVKEMLQDFGTEKYIANLGHGMLPGNHILY
ncbi:hypothetical protein HDV02_002542 [Globomyces sp. JEL0801]|nr:hypothetical protein HDV02_002542 [Globomyces sp. JEL0801]